MLIEAQQTEIVPTDSKQTVSEVDHHWLNVAKWIIEANSGQPGSDDINPLIKKVEHHLGPDIWKVLLACK